MNKRNYPIHEAFQEASIGKTKGYQLIKEGRGPRRFKIGSRVYVTAQALDDWLNKLEAENLVSDRRVAA